MSKIQHDEPNLEEIDDFNDKESDEKRNTVKLVIVFILIVGAVYTYFKYENNSYEDYIGTEEKPGISTTKGAY